MTIEQRLAEIIQAFCADALSSTVNLQGVGCPVGSFAAWTPVRAPNTTTLTALRIA